MSANEPSSGMTDLAMTKAAERRGMKARARATVRRQYWLVVVVCLFAAFLGVEYGSSLWATTAQTPGVEVTTVDFGDDLSWQDRLGMLVEDIADGDEQAARNQVAANEEAIRRGDTNPMFGRTRGVFASLLNSFSSGSIVLSVLDSTRSILRSGSVAVVVLVLASLAAYCFVWLFVRESYRVVARRMLLEARVYERVPLRRFLFPLQTHRWARIAWVMFVRNVWMFLWSLTLVGGVIKYFSYFLVPYIMAENPSLTARQAVTLSRRMMRGHKWECFVAHVSFLGWWLVGFLTLGLANVLYVNGYRAMFFCEWYVRLRTLAKSWGMPDVELLNDEALFAKPAPDQVAAVYADVTRELECVRKEAPRMDRPAGFMGWLAGTFGVLARPNGEVARWQRHQARLDALTDGRQILGGKVYPGRLSPTPMAFRVDETLNLNATRSYTLVNLTIMFFVFCLTGWLWEVMLAFLDEGMFVNRGTLHGPWLPIYGTGGIIILVLLKRLREHPALLFVGTVTLCGTLEYVSSWWLEQAHGERWWDYSGYFLNLNGRICAEGLLVFGLGGLAITYVVAPALDDLLNRVNPRTLTVIALALLALYAVDFTYSAIHPNAGPGVTDYRGSQPVEIANITNIANMGPAKPQ